MKPIEDLLPILAQPKKIIITHHYNADADALGSSLGLCHYLRLKGHDCKVVSPNVMPEFIMWMPDALNVLLFDKQENESIEAINNADILFSLDYNHFSRTKKLESTLRESPGIKVMIDHHLFPDTIFDFGISLPEKSSTCEMIYDFINLNQDNELINMDIAKCLYAGVMTDTGSFKFACTTASVHYMIADLMTKGLETTPIHQAVFDTYEERRLRFLGYVLSEKLILIPECHASIIAISRQELNKFHISTGDTEGIVNYPLSLKNVLFSIFISEREEEIRMSFRSKGNYNVNEFARENFQGGGHANAAGGKSEISLSDTVEKLKTLINQNKNTLQQCYQELL